VSVGSGFFVNLPALGSAAGDITGVLTKMDGYHVNDIDCDPVSFGHDHLAGTTKDFCGRWQQGVKNLTQDSQRIADRLAQTVTTYGRADTGAVDALKLAASSVVEGVVDPSGDARDAAL